TNIELGFIHRERLDQRGALGQDRAELQRYHLVDVEARLYEYQLSSVSLRRHRRHRRTHAELACLVARGCHDAALTRSAYGDWLAAQVRIVTLFDRGVERIHINMDDLALSRRAGRDLFGVRGLVERFCRVIGLR